MLVYFAAATPSSEAVQKRFSKIVGLLQTSGVGVISNMAHLQTNDFSKQDIERIDQAGETMMEQVDGIIIDDTKPLEESGYLVASGLTHKKPILYVVEKGKVINKNLLHIQKEPAAAKLLRLETYTDTSIEKLVIGFLALIEKGGGRELASIKFTLRITKRIERYLHWKTHNTALSKADYLRDLIEDLMNKDKDYQKFNASND